MPDTSLEMVLVKDDAGNFYALTQDIIEQTRIPDEQKYAAEALAGGDVSVFGGQLTSQPQRYSLVGSFSLTAGRPSSAVFAAGYYFQFMEPAAE